MTRSLRESAPCELLNLWFMAFRPGTLRCRTPNYFRRAAGLPLGYEPSQHVLLVGEGNFSFARALLRLFGGQGSGIVATAFDTEAVVLEKYEASLRLSPAVRRSALSLPLRLLALACRGHLMCMSICSRQSVQRSTLEALFKLSLTLPWDVPPIQHVLMHKRTHISTPI